MKMFFLLKNNARRGMGGKGVLKKGEEKGQNVTTEKFEEFDGERWIILNE